MDKPDKNVKSAPPDSDEECLAFKVRTRGRKRKRIDSESSTDIEDKLPENAEEVEKNLQNAALKNNLDDVSVKKILKKVVTNDHVLALVKIREEEEMALSKEQDPKPKLTRSKAKELMKGLPKSVPWNLELTPIKHIPVKTRPEVEALINNELPDDEDDDEYKPTQDDVPSDDDQTLESASDVDSQPATPGTPLTPHSHAASPQVVQDGPFKVPQSGITSAARRKLIIEEEEATIALRTRSKLSLSETPIEHIESSFVPPDDVPTPLGDSLWNQFLDECLNPDDTKNEDDDEADPEYNVAADQDAHDEDEDQLESGIMKISKKELNDLVTELFSIMPEDEHLAERLANNVLTDAVPGSWEGKQEPKSDEEKGKLGQTLAERQKRDGAARFSIGKSETEDQNADEKEKVNSNLPTVKPPAISASARANPNTGAVNIAIAERNVSVMPAYVEADPPPLLKKFQAETEEADTRDLTVKIDPNVKILPEQLLILQQQLRMHIQLATSNYLQLYVNPTHWNFAPRYKDYLEQLNKMVENNPKSVVGVCNLQPAMELVRSWEETVSKDTPENKEMVEFVKKESDRSRRRYVQNQLYVGNFPEMFLRVVSNSTVFQYPYLLPAMPYRAEHNRKFAYRLPEDEFIVLGLDQFWQYVEDNPELFKPPKFSKASRYGLTATCGLVVRHMMPWLTTKWLQYHVCRSRRAKHNPISRYLTDRHVTKVQHKLLPFNPKLTLYEQPAYEMPKLWVRYLAKSCKRFKYFYYKRAGIGVAPEGVPVTVDVQEPIKKPLPPDFTAPRVNHRRDHKPWVTEPSQDNYDLVVVNRPTGPMLTINPITSDNLDNVITTEKRAEIEVSVTDNEKVTVNGHRPKDIVAIPNTFNTPITRRSEEGTVSTNNLGHVINTINSRINNTPMNTVQGQNLPKMFRVVKTSTGSYLLPVTVIQNTSTVNSITQPISSAFLENNRLDTSKNTRTPEDINGHCQCCVLLKKICKESQPRITDFFTIKKADEPCECTYRRFPKITRRLKMLVNNYKSMSWCEQRRLRTILDSIEKEQNNKKIDGKESDIDCAGEISLEDIEYVATFNMKLTRRAAMASNPFIKTKVNLILSNFDPDTGDPTLLSQELRMALDKDLEDLHQEFIGFLNPEQADRIGRFNDYFIHSCIGGLTKRIEKEIVDPTERSLVLTQLSAVFDARAPPCVFCAAILRTVSRRPSLAKHVFSLFPHRVNRSHSCEKENSVEDSIHPSPSESPAKQSMNCESLDMSFSEQSEPPTPEEVTVIENEILAEIIVSKTENVVENSLNENIVKETVVGSEKTVVGSEETVVESEEIEAESDIIILKSVSENEGFVKTPIGNTTRCEETLVVQFDEVDSIRDEQRESRSPTIDSEEFEEYMEIKEEPQDTEESTPRKTHNTSNSPIMSEDEQDTEIKSEPSEWTRDEDTFILTILSECIKRNDQMLDILNEGNIYQTVIDKYPYKCMEEVKERVLRILEILVMSDY